MLEITNTFRNEYFTFTEKLIGEGQYKKILLILDILSNIFTNIKWNVFDLSRWEKYICFHIFRLKICHKRIWGMISNPNKKENTIDNPVLFNAANQLKIYHQHKNS